MKRSLQVVYDVADQFMDGSAREAKKRGTPIPCRKGCSACCSILPMVMLAEMIEAALRLRRDHPERVLEVHTEAVRQTRWLMRRDASAELWFNNGEKCSLLLPDGACSVYAVRPMNCRTYAVLSPPEDCRGPAVGKVLRVDASEVKDFTWSQAKKIHEHYGIPELYGPLPFMFLCALRILTRGVDSFRAGVEGTIFGDTAASVIFWGRLEGLTVEPEIEHKYFGPAGVAGMFDEHGECIALRFAK